MPKITTCLWFDKNAEEAANFYISIFPSSKILEVVKASVDTPSGPKGSVLLVNFILDGHEFTALNGGPYFKLSEAVSFVINCKDQEEIDYYWEKLSSVPESEQCGWCKDKFGLSWQIVPENIDQLISSEEGMKAMLEMKKIDIEKLKKANEGK
jgi:predicted 3-demethylubiquinone-9 3-methyltransferase (glyoxalase superfamily)